jgi:transposase
MRRLEDRIRDLERLLGRKTMEIEILREALAKSVTASLHQAVLSRTASLVW